MRVTIALLLGEGADSDSFLDFTVLSDYKAPNEVTVASLLNANPGIISSIESDFDVSIARELDDDGEVVLFITESPDWELDEVMQHIQEIHDVFNTNLTKLGYRQLTHVVSVYETFPEEGEIEKFSRVNSNLKVLN